MTFFFSFFFLSLWRLGWVGLEGGEKKMRDGRGLDNYEIMI